MFGSGPFGLCLTGLSGQKEFVMLNRVLEKIGGKVLAFGAAAVCSVGVLEHVRETIAFPRMMGKMTP